MAFKLVITLALFGIASAYIAPLTLIPANRLAPLRVVQVQQDSLPQYTYSYGVHDSISGDSKTQTETRNGDQVKGEYSLNDADGYKRTVTYTSDSENGFQAVVDRKPIADIAADIQASIAAQSNVPVAAPLVIKNLTPLNVTDASSIVQPAAPLVYYTQGLVNSAPLPQIAPLIVNSAPIAAPLAYNAPLIVNSAPIAYPGSESYLIRSVFKPIENVTFPATPVHTIAHAPSYLIINN